MLSTSVLSVTFPPSLSAKALSSTPDTSSGRVISLRRFPAKLYSGSSNVSSAPATLAANSRVSSWLFINASFPISSVLPVRIRFFSWLFLNARSPICPVYFPSSRVLIWLFSNAPVLTACINSGNFTEESSLSLNAYSSMILKPALLISFKFQPNSWSPVPINAPAPTFSTWSGRVTLLIFLPKKAKSPIFVIAPLFPIEFGISTFSSAPTYRRRTWSFTTKRPFLAFSAAVLPASCPLTVKESVSPSFIAGSSR